MRYKYIYALIILIGIAAAFYSLFHELQKVKAERDEQRSNFAASVQEPGKTTAEYSVTKKEFKTLFPAEFKQLDSLKRTKRVQSFHTVEWKYLIDTVLLPSPEPEIVNPFEGNVWTYRHECLNADITKADTAESISVRIYGSIPVFITTNLYRPKLWFWKLKWNKFEDSTTVETPCGLTIEKNVKFNIK